MFKPEGWTETISIGVPKGKRLPRILPDRLFPVIASSSLFGNSPAQVIVPKGAAKGDGVQSGGGGGFGGSTVSVAVTGGGLGTPAAVANVIAQL